MSILDRCRTFYKNLPDLAPVVREVTEHFQNAGYDVQADPRASHGWDISITKGGLFKAICGLRTALKIEIEPRQEFVFVRLSVGIFGTEVIPTLITLFLFAPVILAQIWGLVKQSSLDEEAMQVVSDSLDRHASAQIGVTSRADSAAVCKQCGSNMPLDAAFCPGCGTMAER